VKLGDDRIGLLANLTTGELRDASPDRLEFVASLHPTLTLRVADMTQPPGHLDDDAKIIEEEVDPGVGTATGTVDHLGSGSRQPRLPDQRQEPALQLGVSATVGQERIDRSGAAPTRPTELIESGCKHRGRARAGADRRVDGCFQSHTSDSGPGQVDDRPGRRRAREAGHRHSVDGAERVRRVHDQPIARASTSSFDREFDRVRPRAIEPMQATGGFVTHRRARSELQQPSMKPTLDRVDGAGDHKRGRPDSSQPTHRDRLSNGPAAHPTLGELAGRDRPVLPGRERRGPDDDVHADPVGYGVLNPEIDADVSGFRHTVRPDS
jgi:hypothetical protein